MVRFEMVSKESILQNIPLENDDVMHFWRENNYHVQSRMYLQYEVLVDHGKCKKTR